MTRKVGSIPLAAMFWSLVTVMACAAAPASPSAVQSRITDGSWGGIGIRLDVVGSETRLEFDCSHATIPPLVLDAANRFDVTGLLVLERGGPVREGEPDRSEPARYQGRLDGRTVTLTVTLTGSGEAAGTYTATRGEAPRLRKCR